MPDKDPLAFFPKVLVFAIVFFGLLTLLAIGLVKLF